MFSETGCDNKLESVMRKNSLTLPTLSRSQKFKLFFIQDWNISFIYSTVELEKWKCPEWPGIVTFRAARGPYIGLDGR